MKMVTLNERIIQLERRSEGMSNTELAVKQENDIATVKTSITSLRTQVDRLGATGGATGGPVDIEGTRTVCSFTLISGFPQALEIMENLENHEKKFHAWKNHGI